MTALVSENTIDSRPVRSRCACTEVRLCIVQLSCVCLSDKLKKKKKKQGKNDVSVQKSMSMECIRCQLFKLRILTPLLD